MNRSPRHGYFPLEVVGDQETLCPGQVAVGGGEAGQLPGRHLSDGHILVPYLDGFGYQAPALKGGGNGCRCLRARIRVARSIGTGKAAPWAASPATALAAMLWAAS